MKNKKVKKKESKLFSRIKNIFHMFNKYSREEKKKKQDKKRNKNVSIKPKGFIARKMGVILFWSGFAFMLLVITITLFGRGSSAEVDWEAIYEKNQNYAKSDEAIQFARNFTINYFTWDTSDKGKHSRKETMSRYLADGLNEYAGVDLNTISMNSKFKSAELKKVESKGDNLAHITFKVNFDLIQPAKSEEEEDKVNNNTKYFVVPIAYDGFTFGVYELPKFTFIEEETTLKGVKSIKLRNAEMGVREDIRAFLNTFFSSYAQDSKDKLSYLLTNVDVTEGLKGTMQFKEVKSSDIFLSDDGEGYVVFTEVVFIDDDTQIPFITNYQLSVVKQEDRYVVAGIDDLKDKKVNSSIEQDKSLSEEQEIQLESTEKEQVN